MAKKSTITGEELSPIQKVKNRDGIKSYLKQYWMLYVMLIPMVVYLLIFNYYPMAGIQLAFKDWKMLQGQWGSPWASIDGQTDILKHFNTFFNDKQAVTLFGNTIRIALLHDVFGLPVPVILALLLNELTSSKFKKTVQTISYLPHFISWVIISGIIFSMFESGAAVQKLIKFISGKELMPFVNDKQFIGVLIVSGIWKGAGWGTIIYFAALTAIDPSLYEAAVVDGANRWQRTRFITIPGMLPAFSINMIFQISGITSAGFDQIYNLYNASLYYTKADVLETYIFRIGVTAGKYDIATALGLFNSVIGFILTVASNTLVKKMGGTAIW